jgi:hypothetical protein
MPRDAQSLSNYDFLYGFHSSLIQQLIVYEINLSEGPLSNKRLSNMHSIAFRNYLTRQKEKISSVIALLTCFNHAL